MILLIYSIFFRKWYFLRLFIPSQFILHLANIGKKSKVKTLFSKISKWTSQVNAQLTYENAIGALRAEKNILQIIPYYYFMQFSIFIYLKLPQKFVIQWSSKILFCNVNLNCLKKKLWLYFIVKAHPHSHSPPNWGIACWVADLVIRANKNIKYLIPLSGNQLKIVALTISGLCPA